MRSFLTITAVCVGLAALTPAYAGDKVWISLGDAALVQLQKHRPSARAVASVKADAAQDASALSVAAKPEGIHLVEVDEDALASLSHSIHEELRRCGGYMYHPSQEAGLAALQRHSTPGASQRLAAALVATRPNYTIDQQAVVTPILSQMQASNIGQTQVGGLANKQDLNIGNVKGDGKSDVKADKVLQTQVGGLANKQTINLGNVKGGGSSKVNASNIAQTQVGGLANKQTMDVGNVK